jgi:molybdopterin converting factor small subunit
VTTVHYLGPLREVTGCPSERVDLPGPVSIEGLLDILASRHGPGFRTQVLHQTATGSFFYQIIVNGTNMFALDGMETQVGPTDSVLISIPLGGG